MTAEEREAVRVIRDLKVRISELERQNERLRIRNRALRTMQRKAIDQGRYLHGVLVANGIEANGR